MIFKLVKLQYKVAWIELHLQYPHSILELCVSVGVKSGDLASGLYCVEFFNFDMDKDHHN